MKTTRKVLLASAAVAAMGLGLSSEAQAFDGVNWTWNKVVTEAVDIDVDAVVDVEPTGMVEVEKLQLNIGDITATSNVSGIDNNPPGVNADGTVTLDETITVSVSYPDPDGEGNTVGASGGLVTDDGDSPLDVTFIDGQLSEQANGFNDIIDVNITGEFEVEALDGVNDAVDLPAVESAATAVANNQSVSSSVALTLHDAQFNFGGFSAEDSSTTPGLTDVEVLAAIGSAAGGVSDNLHTNTAATLTLAGALGIITQGDVSATSTVDTIDNATVDSVATAIGNNFSADLEAFTADDAFVVADITQFNYANVDALSTVTGVNINNYSNLQALEIPVVSSVATSIGNNFSINVSSPVVDTNTGGTGTGTGTGGQ